MLRINAYKTGEGFLTNGIDILEKSITSLSEKNSFIAIVYLQKNNEKFYFNY